VKNRTKIILGGVILIGGLVFGFLASAYTIQNLIDAPIKGDFTLGPGKAEFLLDPGEEATKIIHVTSRLGKPMKFKVEIEDFKGSETGEYASTLLGSERGPYSLRDYLYPEVSEFTLNHGQRIDLPVKIKIPQDAEPSGLYGAVIITTSPEEEEIKAGEEGAQGQIKFISRVASLFFVRIKGSANEEGVLEKFSTINSQIFYSHASVPFAVLYRNTGSVHLVPYGMVEIKNMWGKKVEEIEIDPYFVMPNSLRTREMNWQRSSGLGRYTANIYLNRGYKDMVDEASFSFWILPWKIITISTLILITLILAIIWIAKNVEIRKKH